MSVCCLQVLEHWQFSDIKDYTYSGYSFTLVSRLIKNLTEPLVKILASKIFP